MGSLPATKRDERVQHSPRASHPAGQGSRMWGAGTSRLKFSPGAGPVLRAEGKVPLSKDRAARRGRPWKSAPPGRGAQLASLSGTQTKGSVVRGDRPDTEAAGKAAATP